MISARAGWALVVLWVAGGCASRQPAAGLPNPQYQVGGGFIINYKAPAEGTLILADQRTGKLLATRSMEQGEVWEVEIDPTDDDAIKLFGPDVHSARPALYFIPQRMPMVLPPMDSDDPSLLGRLRQGLPVTTQPADEPTATQP